jgi:hypothetical protein
MDDLCDKIKEDVQFPKMWAKRCGFCLELPSVVSNVLKIGKTTEAQAAETIERAREILVGERGFEPPTPWSRIQ